MSNNHIGIFDFRALYGSPEAVKQQIDVLSRPGVAGVALWKQAARGVKFTLKSVAGFATRAEGRSFYVRYCELIGADPQNLTWADLDLLGGESIRVAVVDVRFDRCVAVLNDTAAAGALLECEWDLIAIAIA
jgi:hypothetical protein